MSINFHIVAKREIIVPKKKKNSCTESAKRMIEKIKVNVLQTPTPVTKKIMDSPNPIVTYMDWVKEMGHIEHLDFFKEKIEKMKENGFKFEFYV